MTLTQHVAVIGSGAWSRVHLAALEQNAQVERVTLCGRNVAQCEHLAREFSKIAHHGRELHEVLDDPTVELVDVVLPHHLHAQAVRAALGAGKHVICEKPAALSLAEFDALQTMAAAARRRLLVVMNQLYQPPLRALVERIKTGLIGRPFLLVENAFGNHPLYHQTVGWRLRKSLAGGGVLIDGGYHMVYKHLALLGAVGTPRSVTASTARLNPPEPDDASVSPGGQNAEDRGEDFVSYTVDCGAGLRITAMHGWTLPSSPMSASTCFLAGEKAVVDLSAGWERAALLPRSGQPTPLGLSPSLKREETLSRCLDDYLAAIVEDRALLSATLADPRATLELILAVYESSRRGMTISLDDVPID